MTRILSAPHEFESEPPGDSTRPSPRRRLDAARTIAVVASRKPRLDPHTRMESQGLPGRPGRVRSSLRSGPLLALCASAGLLAGCSDFAPGSAPLSYRLSEATHARLAEEHGNPLKAATQIEGALHLLFGTPQSPSYLRHDDWEEDYDPNRPDLAEDEGGSGEFDEDEIAAMRAENLDRFAHEIERIAKGLDALDRREKVPPSIRAQYVALFADAETGKNDPSKLADPALQAQARALFADYYPRLQDSAELYRQQCLHCHGVEGGGDGPTSGPAHKPFLDPRPRDYRRGIFKFTAVKDKARPRRADLQRVIEEGVYATAMPSFRRYSRAEREGLVDYVRLLAIRGEVETRLALEAIDEGSFSATALAETYKDVWDKWGEAEGKVVAFEGEIPAPTPALLARGSELYHDAKKGNCASCHGDAGLGDGTAAWKIDEATGKKVSAYKDDWGFDIVPRNLTQGLFRGGRRPIDIYRRIYAGINGGPMPGIGEAKDSEGNPVLSQDDMWALVHYVRSLSERDESVHGHPVETAQAPRDARSTGDAHSTGAAADGSGADVGQ